MTGVFYKQRKRCQGCTQRKGHVRTQEEAATRRPRPDHGEKIDCLNRVCSILYGSPSKLIHCVFLQIFFRTLIFNDYRFIIFQFSSVSLSCPTLCDPMNHSTPGLPAHHQLSEFTQTHVHWVSDAIQPSHPLSSPSPPAFNLSQHQGLFKWVSSLLQVAKYWSFSFSISPSNE